eukprot:jgi/Galph1/4454/GphlegSOOS_G3033.1
MAENNRSESTEVRSAAVPTPCVKGCGFYGTSSTLNMCSKCYREHLRQEEQRLQVESVCQQQEQQERHQGGVHQEVKEPNVEESMLETGKTQETHVTGELLSGSSESVKIESSPETQVVHQESSGVSNGQDPAAQPSPGSQRKSRCETCNKKVGLTGFTCRCGFLFCSEHRYSDKHNCTFDFKSQNKELLSKANPQVVAPKINKI